LTSCSAPGAHCGGAGIGGSALSGVAWSGAYGRGKLPRSRRTVKPREYRPVEVFTLSGGLGLRLKGGRIERPAEGVAHWLASGLGIFSKQVERYSVGEFLERFFRFLRDTRLQNILMVELDYNPVYRDKTNKTKDDLSDAITAARKYLSDHGGAENKVLISALGKTKMDPMKDLHLTVEGQYYRKHGFGKPGLELWVTGIPSVLLPRKKETKIDYKARQAGLARRLNDARKLASFRKGCEKMFGVVLRDYAAHLEGVFDVDLTEKQVSSWGSIP